MAKPITLFKTIKGVTPIKIGRRRTFVSGLDWQVLTSSQNHMVEARKIAKREKKETGQAFEVVYLRRHADIVQAGFIVRGGRARPGTVSLAAVAADTLGSNFVAAFALPDGRYAMAACMDNAIVPDMDLVCEPDEAKRRIHELWDLRVGSGELDVFAPDELWQGGKAFDLEDLLPNVRHRHRLRHRANLGAPGLKSAVIWGAVALLGAASWYGWQFYQTQLQEKQEAELARQLELLRSQAGDSVADASLMRSWTNKPSLRTLASECTKSIGQVPITLDGWILINASCTASSTAATFARTEGRTVTGFASTAKGWRDPVTIQFSSDGDLGTIEWRHALAPGGDEGLIPMQVRSESFMSWWQSRFVPFELKPTPSVFAAGYQPHPAREGTDSSRPNWKTALWEIKSAPQNPENLLSGIDPSGLRLLQVELDFDTDGQLKWHLKGELYGE